MKSESVEEKLDRLLVLVDQLKSASRMPELLPIPEVARLYSIGKDEVRRLIDEGKLKVATRKPRRGQVRYVVDAGDARRVLGSR